VLGYDHYIARLRRGGFLDDSLFLHVARKLIYNVVGGLWLSSEALFDWSCVGRVYLMFYQLRPPQIVFMAGKHVLLLM